jgi:hypothetical protein
MFIIHTLKKEITMRELTMNEVELVSGASGTCTAPPSGSEQSWEDGVGNAISGIYEGAVDGLSHIIQRVSDALQ